ncbi:winged helix-turn-helix transcriptional regulator [Candidatus Pyrohabitans sp.]
MDARRRIYEVVSCFPGVHFREIQRITRLGNGCLRYHLNVLERCGAIESEKYGRRLRYYPRGMNSYQKKLLALLHLDTARRILVFLLNHSGARHGDIARVLKLSPSTVSWHMRKLVECGVVCEIRGIYLLCDTEGLRKVLQLYRRCLGGEGTGARAVRRGPAGEC